MRKRLHLLSLLAILALPRAAMAEDRNRAEVVRAAFGCDYEVLSSTLTDAQMQSVTELGGHPKGKTVLRIRPTCADAKSRRSGYIVTRVVRTLSQTLLVVIAHDDTVEKVELLAFLEPAEYKGTARWYRAFAGRVFNDDLNVQRAIPLMAGATITSRSTTQAVRDVLALHTVLLGN